MQGDTDVICAVYYERTEGVTLKRCCRLIPASSELGAASPHGTAIDPPDAPSSPVTETINLLKTMTEGEKASCQYCLVIGAIRLWSEKVLAGGEPITRAFVYGRMLLGGFVSMVAGVVLVQFPDMSLPAVCGIGIHARYCRLSGGGNRHSAPL